MIEILPPIKIESMEDERLVYSVITPDTPKSIKATLLRAIEQFEEQRTI